MDVAQRRHGDVIGGLHQREFGRRLDQADGFHQGVAGHDAIGPGACLAHAVDDEEARGGFEGDRAGW